jgi:predicted RNA-binding protein with PUA domain
MIDKKHGLYATCKGKVVAIQDAYDALVDAVEDYKALLTTLIEECDEQDEYDKHVLVVANLQRNTANGLLGTLDTDLHDDLTRLSDRVIRFKHLEDGIFL